ncbi:MAG: DnaJ domain-containing protein [Bryobacteraceae bacterium]
MMLTAGLYGATVVLVLATIIHARHKRTRRVQPALCGLDPFSPKGPIESGQGKKRSDRVGSALRAWTERAEADLVVPSRPMEPEPATVPEPAPEMQVANHAPRTQPAVEAPASRDYSEWGDYSEWIPEPEPLSEPAAKAADDANAANQDRFSNQSADAENDRFRPPSPTLASQSADYYETLQISPNADPETIHRVYRIMAARFHPDNPTTGSLERFLLLREAYQTLSDPELRAEYDASRQSFQAQPLPIFWQRSFVDGIEGETNRRLGVLSLLYQRRRISESKPGVSLLELEQRMAFPREYLNFTLWYLRSKGYVTVMPDNSDYTLTSTGVDYVESGSNSNKVIRELLTAGTGEEYAQMPVRPKVVPFPRATARPRVEGSRRIQRRRQAGRR